MLLFSLSEIGKIYSIIENKLRQFTSFMRAWIVRACGIIQGFAEPQTNYKQ